MLELLERLPVTFAKYSELVPDKTNKLKCAPIEDREQPGHLSKPERVIINVRMSKT